MRINYLLCTALTVATLAGTANAAVNTKSGIGPNGTAWTATSRIIGATATGTTPATNPGGGDARYLAPNSAGYSGVVGMLMTYANGDRFVCSGSLVGNRSVVSAGHCVSKGGGVKDSQLVKTQIFFQNDASSKADERVYGLPTGNTPAGVTVIDVANYTVAKNYTGEVIDQNDIAVLTLAQAAPRWAKRYELFTDNLWGKNFNVTGYGQRSTIGGAAGNVASAPTGYRRQGDNTYDYAWGDNEFNGFFTDRDAKGENFFGKAEVEYSFVSDFDNGTAANDAGCKIAAASGAGRYGCGTGLGAREVNIAGGDSGGGAFVDGKLASVNSYGLSFGAAYGDFLPGLNSSWGEFSGYVPIGLHANLIRSAIAAAGPVPEPSTWAQMLAGFGLIGFAARRRSRLAVTA